MFARFSAYKRALGKPAVRSPPGVGDRQPAGVRDPVSAGVRIHTERGWPSRYGAGGVSSSTACCSLLLLGRFGALYRCGPLLRYGERLRFTWARRRRSSHRLREPRSRPASRTVAADQRRNGRSQQRSDDSGPADQHRREACTAGRTRCDRWSLQHWSSSSTLVIFPTRKVVTTMDSRGRYNRE